MTLLSFLSNSGEKIDAWYDRLTHNGPASVDGLRVRFNEVSEHFENCRVLQEQMKGNIKSAIESYRKKQIEEHGWWAGWTSAFQPAREHEKAAWKARRDMNALNRNLKHAHSMLTLIAEYTQCDLLRRKAQKVCYDTLTYIDDILRAYEERYHENLNILSDQTSFNSPCRSKDVDRHIAAYQL